MFTGPTIKKRTKWIAAIVIVLTAMMVTFTGWYWHYTQTPEYKARQLMSELREHCRGSGTIEEWLIDLGILKEKEGRDLSEITEDLVDLGKPAVPTLIKALNDEDIAVQTCAASILVEIGQPPVKVVPVLIRALKAESNGVRCIAVVSLGEIYPPDKEVVSALILVLEEDKDGMVRSIAAEFLGKMGPTAKEAVPALVEAMKDEEWGGAAALALERIGSAAVPALAEALKDKYFYARLCAAGILGEIGPTAKEAVPALIQTLKDEDFCVRSEAVEALGKIGPVAKEAVPALTEALKDKNELVRQTAAEALKRIKEKELRNESTGFGTGPGTEPSRN